MLSEQDGSLQIPAMHELFLQSLFDKQPSPEGHAPHPPPQSFTVSMPFFTLSAQVGFWQTPQERIQRNQETFQFFAGEIIKFLVD